MEYTIKNDYLTAVIASNGAELIKLIDKDGINRLHTPSPDTWNRVSPILFPQISRMRGSEYKVDGTSYKMTTHGFIRDNELEMVEYSQTEVTFKYSHNEKTLEMYPYEFNFFVTYKLNDNKLEVSFRVENTSDKILRYMLGGHPGFKVPLFDDEKYSDYKIVFEKVEQEGKRMCVVDGYICDQYDYYLAKKDTINLDHDLFVDDALIFPELQSSYVDIISINHDKKIRFHFFDFETLAIWSKTDPDLNLLCLEPWNGIQKNFVMEHEKMGVFEIAPHMFNDFSYTIEVI